jgi:hypothetical protein
LANGIVNIVQIVGRNFMETSNLGASAAAFGGSRIAFSCCASAALTVSVEKHIAVNQYFITAFF